MYKSHTTIISVIVIVLYILIVSLILPYSFFPDEHENIVGGWLMTKGLILYKDFFTHHAPVPYFLSSVIAQFTSDIKLFRLLVLLFSACNWFFLFHIIHKQLIPILLLTFFLIVISTPVFVTHMFVADTFVAMSLFSIFVILVDCFLHKKTFTNTRIGLIIMYTFIAFWSSVSSILPLIGLNIVFALVNLFQHPEGEIKNKRQKLNVYEILFSNLLTRGKRVLDDKKIVFLILLQGIIPFYFFLKNSFSEFLFSVFSYNSLYYFPLYLAHDANEKKYGFGYRLIQQFIFYVQKHLDIVVISIKTLILTIKGILISNLFQLIPVAFSFFLQQMYTIETIGFVVFCTILLILIHKKVIGGVAFIFVSVLFRVRDNNIFHLAPYFYLHFFLLSYFLFYAYKSNEVKKVFCLGALYVIWSILFLQQFYSTLITRQPLVAYDILQRANQVKKSGKTTGTLWVFGPNTIYYMLTDSLPAIKYYYYYPWIDGVFYIHQKVFSDVQRKIPDSIISEYEGIDQSIPDNFFAEDIAEYIRKNYEYSGNKIYQKN